MPTLPDLTPLVFLVVALVAAATLVVLFVRVEQAGEPEERPPYLGQEFPPGVTVEQPTPYYVAPVPESPDPLEVAANTDRKALLATALLFGIFAMMGAYYTLQTGIPVAVGGTTLLDRAKEIQLDVSVERGANLYAQYCFDCHGKRGQGDVGVGLPINRPDNAYRASCGPVGQDQNGKKCKQTDDDKTRDLLNKTIARGRAFPAPRYSMPAWSRDEGGQLNPEQLNQLVNFIMYGDWEEPLRIREALNMELEPKPPARPKEANPAQAGQAVATTTCIACHSFTDGTPSNNPQAPNLAHYAGQGPFSDQLKALKASGDPDWLKKWVSDAPSIKPGTAMPKWQGVISPEQIDAVVQYLMTLK